MNDESLPVHAEAASGNGPKGRLAKYKAEGELAKDSKTAVSATMKAALSVIPGGGVVVEMLNGVEARAQRRQIDMLTRAIETLGEDLSTFKQKLVDDEELADLWARGMAAARATRSREKLEAFAAILSGAVDADHNQRIAGNILLRILEAIEEDHLQLMIAIQREADKEPPADSEGKPELAGARVPDLEVALPHLRPLLGMLINSLVSLQLVRNVYENTWGGMEGRQVYAATDLGNRLLNALHTVESGGSDQD